MLTIWGRKTSSNVQALMWCVGELGLSYERHDVGHHFGGTETDAFLTLNPNGTIPVLQDGDSAPLWETGAILRYLAAEYGDEDFWPQDTSTRAHVDRWAEWAKINIAMNFTVPVFWQVVRTPPKNQNLEAISEALAVLHHNLQIAEKQLKSQQWLAGDNFTLADIQMGHVLFRYFDIDINRQDFPSVRRYYEALKSRSSFEEHVMISYDDLRPR